MNEDENKLNRNRPKIVDIGSRKTKDTSDAIFEQVRGKRYMVIVMGDTEVDLQTLYFNGDVTMMDVVFHCGLVTQLQYHDLLVIQGDYHE